jgi:hypothetical protein
VREAERGHEVVGGVLVERRQGRQHPAVAGEDRRTGMSQTVWK